MATIETPRLILREWTDDDVEAWVAMNADPRVAEFLSRPYPRELSERLLANMRNSLVEKGYGWWAVEVRGATTFAGTICLQKVPFEASFTPAYEIGWRFAAAHWGRGYATEGARGALDFAFATLGLPEVVAFTTETNARSRRVMDRLGMTYDASADFDHPRLEEGHPLRRHVLYRIRSG